MNKIILNRRSNIELVINKDSICNIKKEYSINNLNIVLEKNVKFIINQYSEIINNELNINVIIEDNAEFIYNHSFINDGLYKLNINIIMKGNKSKTVVDIHGICDSGNTNIVIDGSVKEKTLDNKLDEKVKIININKGKTTIYPNMYISTSNVFANHSASITEIDHEYLFYLNSKGIDNLNAKNLIINGFLINDAKD